MQFVLWASVAVHVVSAVVWVGGLVFLNAVLSPVAVYEGETRTRWMAAVHRRFLGFIWSTLWPLLLTGILMMLLHPRFVWFEVGTTWGALLAVKQVSFALMGFFSWQMKQVVQRMERARESDAETFEGWRLALVKLVRRTLVAGLAALLATAGMRVV